MAAIIAVLEFPPSESFRSHVRTCSVHQLTVKSCMGFSLKTHRITVGHKFVSFLLSLLVIASRGRCQRGNNLSKGCERFVDVCTLLQTLASRASGVRAFRTGEVNEATRIQIRVYGKYKQTILPDPRHLFCIEVCVDIMAHHGKYESKNCV